MAGYDSCLRTNVHLLQTRIGCGMNRELIFFVRIERTRSQKKRKTGRKNLPYRKETEQDGDPNVNKVVGWLGKRKAKV